MAETKKTRPEKLEYASRLKLIRPNLPESTAVELNAFCRYTQRDTFHPEHIYNVMRTPIRRYDDEILTALEIMVKTNQKIAA